MPISGTIEQALIDGYMLTDAIYGDMIFRSLDSNNLLFGFGSNTQSVLKIAKSNLTISKPVGIGTANPRSTLEVNGSFCTSGEQRILNTMNSYHNYYMRCYNNVFSMGGQTFGWEIYDNSNLQTEWYAGYGKFGFGPGTSNTSATMHLASPGSTYLRISGCNTSYGGDIGIATTNNAFVTGATTGDVVIKNTAGCNIHLASGSSNMVSVLKTGNIGIGTTNPAYKLDVAGTINATSVLVNGAPVGSGGGGGVGWSNNGSNIFSSSNIGIGTNQPLQKLDVVGGSIRTDNALISTVAMGTAPLQVASSNMVSNLNANYLAGNASTYYTDPANLASAVQVSKGGTGQTTLAANKVIVGNGTTGVLSPTSLHWDNTSNYLGIGTSTPAYSLDVGTGTARAASFYLAGGDTTYRMEIARPSSQFAMGGLTYGFSIYDSNTLQTQWYAGNGKFGFGPGTSNTSATAHVSSTGTTFLRLSSSGTTHVSDIGVASGASNIITGSIAGDLCIRNTTGSNIMFGNGTNCVAIITAAGNLGVGTTNPTYKLHVVGDSVIDGALVCTGDVTAMGSLSDSNLKDNIQDLDQGYADLLSSLRPVSFTWKNDIFNTDYQGKDDIGFIAQEVEQLIPLAVQEKQIKDGTYKVIRYERLFPVLVKSLQELQNTVREQQAEIAELRAMLQN